MVNLHALLIGIDYYDVGLDAGEVNKHCSNLEGAVADVKAMADYLRRIGVPSGRICTLTSPEPGTQGSVPPDRLPTYEIMVAEIRSLKERAGPGDQVLIHYSGHGGRIPTLIPEAKDPRGLDEGLVPANVSEPGARYLRDVELAYLMNEMVAKKLAVTLILDACHSGSMLRGEASLVAKQTHGVDQSERSQASLVATTEKLEKTWRELYNRAYGTVRGGSRHSDWVPAAGFVLLAACRSFESAYERYFDGIRRGVLTWCLLEVLTAGRADLSFRQIYNRLRARIGQYNLNQTPVVEGDATRSLISGSGLRLLDGINILEVDPVSRRLRLGAGQALGLKKGALLEVFAAEISADRGSRAPRATAEITEVEALESWAVASYREAGVAAVEVGDQAVLIDPGTSVRRKVVLVPAEKASRSDVGSRPQVDPAVDVLRDSSPPRDVSADPAEALAAVRQELEGRRGGFLELMDESPAMTPDFQIAASSHEYQIWHSDGSAVADLSPLSLADPGAARRVVARAVHLARFYNVRDLENHDIRSPLYDALELEIDLLPEDFVRGDRIDPARFEALGPVPAVPVGRWVCLTVKNRSWQALEIYVLDLQPGWSIEQVHPPDGGQETLEGKQIVRLPFKIYLPDRFSGGNEVLKVFATARPVAFRWLELPTVDTPIGRSAQGAPTDPLERMFAEVAADRPPTRHVHTHHASRHWMTTQVQFEVVRK